MANNPLNGSSRNRTPTEINVDNSIRQMLRVSDPRDAEEVAEGLKRLYTIDAETLELEELGLPSYRYPVDFRKVEGDTASNTELEQAVSDVDRDLDALIHNSLLKDIQPELKGWAVAIRNLIADGTNAARFALDPGQRDKTFNIRRQLGHYARLSRYLGALSDKLNQPYRRLAQSLDEVAAVLLVLLGESLANSGFTGGQFLPQAPASELQARRDATLHALRNFTGTAQQAYGPNDWPRGVVAYSEFMRRLSESGQSDLRSLFQESYLGQILDDLIDRSASLNADGLRALSATAQQALQQLRRLMVFGQRLVDPESPPLAGFLASVELFLNAFVNAASGSRLLFISRPPIVFYGLYGIGGPDVATTRLLDIIQRRGRLAEWLDCFLGCECDENRVLCQVLMDKILHDVDRAIDLYALGTQPNGRGEPERRAAAFGYLIRQFRCEFTPDVLECDDIVPREDRRCLHDDRHVSDNIGDVLGELEELLIELNPAPPVQDLGVPPEQRFHEYCELHDELCIQRNAESHWWQLVQTLAPSCLRHTVSANHESEAWHLADRTARRIRDMITAADLDAAGLDEHPCGQCPTYEADIPPHYETSLAALGYLRSSFGGTR